MDLSQKIQKLRKAQGLTQEQFAEQLFVTRTAVSKWETGRGTPSMVSLQLIAKLCGVTLDELLQAEEIFAVAQCENKENLNRFALYMDGLFAAAALVSVFLPLYKTEGPGMFYSVALYRFTGWLAGVYWFFPLAMAALGILQLLAADSENGKLKRSVYLIGLLLNIGAVFVLILSGQPYPALLFFSLLVGRGAAALLKQK
ncbi:MAG: helix-turn-helix transcriptional regulator [Oscillospiraceae bacterium]|nr:helix-turn-helix transcriptional regulator [Oscillospiraceae bacterium]